MKAEAKTKTGGAGDKDQKAGGKAQLAPAQAKKPDEAKKSEAQAKKPDEAKKSEAQAKKPDEAKKSEEKSEPPKVEDFIAAKKFVGAKPGMVFKKGKQGLGYYKDTYVPPAGTKRKLEASAAQAPPPAKKMQLQGGLQYEVTKSGKAGAPTASRGQRVQVKYEGRLAKNGKRFDKGTIRFKLGAGEVIRGWDMGVSGMTVGEARRLLIPPKFGYGASGAPPDIPPNATLAFDVELLRIN
jgi:FK506-binding nuclear protein